ncbi:MAG: rhomboid family intramembrane serine protease [Caldibacillus sp.]
MSFREDFVYWKIAHFLVTKRNYQAFYISRDHEEIWLENIKDKERPVIRLRRFDIDWSNWIRNDLEHVILFGEQIKKSYLKKELPILNIYFSMEAPIDPYEQYFANLVKAEEQGIVIRSLLVTGSALVKDLRQVEELLGVRFQIDLEREYESFEVDRLKWHTLERIAEKKREEERLFHQDQPRFTYIFIGIQIFIFLLMELFGSSRNTFILILFGAKYTPLILEGQWWRLITPMFLHIGIIHLLMNSMALYFLGTTVERIFGRFRFLFIFLLAGFMGNVASFVFSSPQSISAGASGGIFGLFGALLFFGLVHPRPFFRTMGANIITLVGINLLIGFLPGIDFAGHLGGLVGGFLAAAIVSLPREKNFPRQIIAFIATLLITIFGLYFGFNR